MENQTNNQQQNKQANSQESFKNRDIKRHTAYRFFIGMIKQGKPEFHGERFLHISSWNKIVSRVNIIANITEKFMSEQKPYCALTVDDGTGTIRIKAFSDSLDLIKNFEQGDTINVIGRLNYYNNEVYILPEIAKNSSITWLIARKLELEKEYGKDILKKLSEQQEISELNERKSLQEQQGQQVQEQETLQEQTTEEKVETTENSNSNSESEVNSEQDIKQEILKKIQESETEGIDIDKIIMSMNKSVDEINKAITDLLDSGEIYEPKPGRLRIL